MTTHKDQSTGFQPAKTAGGEAARPDDPSAGKAPADTDEEIAIELPIEDGDFNAQPV